MKLFLKLATIAAVMSVACASVQADTVTDNTTLAAPGVYFGHGNEGTNGGWTVDVNNGVEVGLRAKLRQDPSTESIVPVGNLYYAPTGPQTQFNTAPGGPGNAARDAWNYEFSINLNGTGLTLNDITDSTLTITNLTTGAGPVLLHPVTIGDDSTWNPSTTPPGTSNGTFHIEDPQLTDVAVQNSENPLFGGFPSGLDYNMNAEDVYLFTLDVVQNSTGDTLASDSIEVSTAPLPPVASMGALMLGLVGFGAFFRFRNARKVA